MREILSVFFSLGALAPRGCSRVSRCRRGPPKPPKPPSPRPEAGRLAGYEDVNDAERLRHDPAMRWIVGGKAAQSSAASPSQMGRFETQWLAAPKNFAALAHLSGQWIDLMHGRRPPRGIVLDMDSNQNSWTAHRVGSVQNLSHFRFWLSGARPWLTR